MNGHVARTFEAERLIIKPETIADLTPGEKLVLGQQPYRTRQFAEDVLRRSVV